MRKLAVVCSLMFVLLAVRPAFATDCGAQTASGYGFEDYSAEKLNEGKTSWDCWSLYGLSPTTMANWYGETGFEMGYITASAVRSYTVPTGGPTGHFEVTMRVEMVDPHSTIYNQISSYVLVYHVASSTYSNYPLYYHDGTMGSDTGSSPWADIYNVATGDTITIYINGVWSFDTDSHSRFTDVHLFHIDN